MLVDPVAGIERKRSEVAPPSELPTGFVLLIPRCREAHRPQLTIILKIPSAPNAVADYLSPAVHPIDSVFSLSGPIFFEYLA